MGTSPVQSVSHPIDTIQFKNNSSKPGNKLRSAFGINAFEWDFAEPGNPAAINEEKMNMICNFSAVRHYLDWEKLEGTEGSYTFNPTAFGGWNYDAIYERCKKAQIEVVACLKTIPPWMQQTYPPDERDNENVPVKFGSELSSPRSYIGQAKAAFQFAARYGTNNAISASLITLSSLNHNGRTNSVKVGLALVRYIECDNERDKWWKGRKAYQKPSEYAANLSAFYDGHKNTMGAGVGVKNADPGMQVVMAGLAKPDTAYVKQMIDWCRKNRGYKLDGSIDLCWDVINYHFYSNDSEASQGGKATTGVAPELSSAARTAQAFLQFSHQYANDMPVWITEAGYDINQGSPFKAKPVGQQTALQTQADWILRTSLLYVRAGIDKVFFYQLYDDKPGNPKQFSTSGLINSNRSRRPAADFISQVKSIFGDAVYKKTVSYDPVVDIYELKGRQAYVVVVPDQKGRVKAVELNVGNAANALLYSPKAGSDNMFVRSVKPEGGKIVVTATETPVFVLPEEPAGLER